MKIIIITGATDGIGKSTEQRLLEMGHFIIILARNVEKAKKIYNSYQDKAEIIYCDLSSLSTIKSAVSSIKKHSQQIDVLINNAGCISPTREVTKDGFEKMFAINYLGHVLLTKLLIDKLILSNSRVINVSSQAYKSSKLILNDLQAEKSFSITTTYGNSKLCQLYFTKELHNRFNKKGLTSYALHPGVIGSSFGDSITGLNKLLWVIAKPFLRSPENGAKTSVYLATENSIEKLSGKYFINSKPKSLSPKATNKKLQKELWNYTEKLLHKYL